MATVARLVGDLEAAEDGVQDACATALQQWPAEGVPGNPRAWLISVARHKATDRLRRDSRRGAKEAADAVSAYRTALDLAPAAPERAFIVSRIEELSR